MTTSLVVSLLLVGLVAQLAGAALIADDIRRDRALNRELRIQIQRANDTDRAVQQRLQGPAGDIVDDLNTITEGIVGWINAYETGFQASATPKHWRGVTGLAMLLVGVAANFAAALGPLL